MIPADSLFPDLLTESNASPPPPSNNESNNDGNVDNVSAPEDRSGKDVVGDDAVTAFLQEVATCKDSVWFDSNHEKRKQQQQEDASSCSQSVKVSSARKYPDLFDLNAAVPASSHHSMGQYNTTDRSIASSTTRSSTTRSSTLTVQDASGHKEKEDAAFPDLDCLLRVEELSKSSHHRSPHHHEIKTKGATINDTEVHGGDVESSPRISPTDNNDGSSDDKNSNENISFPDLDCLLHIDEFSKSIHQQHPKETVDEILTNKREYCSDDDNKSFHDDCQEEAVPRSGASKDHSDSGNYHFWEDYHPEQAQDDDEEFKSEISRFKEQLAANSIKDNENLEEEEEESNDMFLVRTKGQVVEHLNNAYSADHAKFQNSDGRLTTSLCEDVYSIVRMYFEALQEQFSVITQTLSSIENNDDGSKTSNNHRKVQSSNQTKAQAIQAAFGAILKHLYEIQIQSRDQFLVDLETCCAAANDFIRMGETLEDFVTTEQETLLEVPDTLSDDDNDANRLQPQDQEQRRDTPVLEELTALLLGLYNRDAIFAVRKANIYIIEALEAGDEENDDGAYKDDQEHLNQDHLHHIGDGHNRPSYKTAAKNSVAEKLFGKRWLNEWFDNEVALIIIRTIDDFLEDLESFLDAVILGKILEAIITSVVIFYFKSLINKSPTNLKLNRSVWKENNQNCNRRGLDRMMGDIKILSHYFENLATTYSSSFPSLMRTVNYEFEVLYAIHELLSIAAGVSDSNLRDEMFLHHLFVLHERLRDFKLTTYVVGDLYHLVNPGAESEVYKFLDTIHAKLGSVLVAEPDDDVATKSMIDAHREKDAPGLCLGEELATVVEDCKVMRIRPGLKTSSSTTPTEQGEIIWNMFSQRSTHYRKKVTKSIEKTSKKYSRNATKSLASISRMAQESARRTENSARKHMVNPLSPKTTSKAPLLSKKIVQTKLSVLPKGQTPERFSTSKNISSKLARYKKRFS